MLTSLRIKNLALVSDLLLELAPGYNAITGETGAGKSIVIGALNLVLGQRADRALIRSGSDTCSVEASFDVARVRAPIKNFLAANGLEPCDDNQLVLKRSFTNAGTNRQFVNGSATTLTVLVRLGDWLVDLHGPHDHQSLLQPAKQLAILDAFGGLEADCEVVGELVRRRTALEAGKSALIVDEKTYAQQLDLLRFQVQEIAAARFQPDEETQIEQEHHCASNAARLLQLSQAALEALGENESSLLTQAGGVGRTLQDLMRVDAGAAALTELHAQAVATLRDLQSELSRYADKVDVDPARLQELEERLNLIHALKRKYGASLPEVIAFGEEAKRQLQGLESRDAELGRLDVALAKLDGDLLRAGKQLSAKRRKVIPQLAKAVGRQLSDLGFNQSQFEVAMASGTERSNHDPRTQTPTTFSPSEGERFMDRAGVRGDLVSATGLDSIEFLFSPNVGEPAKPLRTIASSGEMARVMLALKTVLAVEDEVPVLIFDEVDANVGGETANAVGEKMKQIAAQRQVLCITHLPQVAATATAHYVVTKQVQDGRTITVIELLDAKARITELARMLGGQSEVARKHAAALLK